MADIVSDFLERLHKLAPDTPQETLKVLEVQVRHQWGGMEAYVAKRPAWFRSISMGAALRSGKSLAQAIEDSGLRRTQGYEILRRR
jgi:hypothetical protein